MIQVNDRRDQTRGARRRRRAPDSAPGNLRDEALASCTCDPGAEHRLQHRPRPGGEDRSHRLRHGPRPGGDRGHGGHGPVPDHRRHRHGPRPARARAGLRGDHGGPLRRHPDHVDLDLHRRLAGPGSPTLTEPGPGPCEPRTAQPKVKPMPVSTYVPEKFPHHWLSGKVELKSWGQIEPWFQRLLAMPIESADDLERWVFAAGGLNSAGGQGGGGRDGGMTSQTGDPPPPGAYLEFIRDIEPKLKPLQNEVRNRYLDSPFRKLLPADRYAVFNRALENRRALYREENIPRETQLAELEQRYQKMMGAMTVSFRGQERTLAQMAPFLEETDRSVRQEAWELAARRRLQDKEALDDLFDQMMPLRIEIARAAGFDNFVEFAFRQRERF